LHIPDGFLDTKTWASLILVSGAAIGASASKAGRSTDGKRIPLMGVMAAFIFAVQMLNFPVAGGTSGHFMGTMLSAFLLGPYTTVLVMSSVLIVQCLVFQDGGLTALGANIFNMSGVGIIAGYGLYAAFSRFLRPGSSAAGKALLFVSAWLSVVGASLACALELSFSGTVPAKAVLPAMLAVHALIGLGEGAITVAVAGFIGKIRPDLLRLERI